jgi:hypothetical protein
MSVTHRDRGVDHRERVLFVVDGEQIEVSDEHRTGASELQRDHTVTVPQRSHCAWTRSSSSSVRMACATAKPRQIKRKRDAAQRADD